MNSNNIFDENIEQANILSRKAIDEGTDILCFPENVLLMSSNNKDLFSKSYEESNNPGLNFFIKLAKKYRKWVLVGSLSIKISNVKLTNRSYWGL